MFLFDIFKALGRLAKAVNEMAEIFESANEKLLLRQDEKQIEFRENGRLPKAKKC